MTKLDKVWPAVALAVEESVEQVLCGQRQSEDLAVSVPKLHRKWGARDRRFFITSLFDLLRYWIRFVRLVDGDYSATDRMLIRKALYAMWYSQGKDLALLPGGPEFSVQRDAEMPNDAWESFPDELAQMLREEYADTADEIMRVMNEPAKLCLRVNLLKTSVRKMEEILRQADISFTTLDDVPGAIILDKHRNLRDYEWMQKGWVEVQDVSSQRLGHFIRPREGSRILDACAGTGGKSLHLASLTANRAAIFATDIYPAKLDMLDRRVKRDGATSVRRLPPDDLHHPGKFDLILLDVPCTGSGTLRHKPEAKLRLNRQVVEQKIELQRLIVNDNIPRLADGGEIIYSTCSIFHAENRGQVDFFINKYGLKLLDESVISPLQGFDGFYMARLGRE